MKSDRSEKILMFCLYCLAATTVLFCITLIVYMVINFVIGG